MGSPYLLKNKELSMKNAMSKTRAVPDGDTHDMKEALDALEALEPASKPATPWWVIALKTLAYLIGLLLAGYGTSAAAQTLLNF